MGANTIEIDMGASLLMEATANRWRSKSGDRDGSSVLMVRTLMYCVLIWKYCVYSGFPFPY